ncbi:MAG: LON peptidase substrate-binding domain-containing protein [Tenuifilaceae bacterium]
MIRQRMEPKTTKLAMFPLKTFLLPGEEIPLRIFEPRYKELINECDEKSMTFGIPFIIEDQITVYGSEVELLSIVAKNSLNEMVILVKCIRNFHLLDFFDELPGKLYGGGIIEYLDDNFESTNPELIVLLKKLKLDIDNNLGTLITSNSLSLVEVAKSLFLKSDDKYKFYALRNQDKMEKFLIKQLKFYELVRKQEEVLQKNFNLN